MASPFTVILNSFLNARNHIQNAAGTWMPAKQYTTKMSFWLTRDFATANADGTVTVHANEFIIIDAFDKDVIIDTIEYATNSNDVHAVLFKDANGLEYEDSLFHTINPSQSRWKATPVRLANDGNPYLQVQEYDTVNNEFKVMNTRPIHLPHGCRLAFRHDDTKVGGERITYKVVYRER